MAILDKYTLVWKKSDVEERYQCNECGMHTGLVNGEAGLGEWDNAHAGCDKYHALIPESDPAPEPEPKIEPTEPPPADPEEEPEEEVELSREELKVMTKRKIVEEYAPDWDGTKAALIDHLLEENEED